MNIDGSRIKTIVVDATIPEDLASNLRRAHAAADDVAGQLLVEQAYQDIEKMIVHQAASGIAKKLYDEQKFLITKNGTKWRCRIDVILPETVMDKLEAVL